VGLDGVGRGGGFHGVLGPAVRKRGDVDAGLAHGDRGGILPLDLDLHRRRGPVGRGPEPRGGPIGPAGNDRHVLGEGAVIGPTGHVLPVDGAAPVAGMRRSGEIRDVVRPSLMGVWPIDGRSPGGLGGALETGVLQEIVVGSQGIVDVLALEGIVARQVVEGDAVPAGLAEVDDGVVGGPDQGAERRQALGRRAVGGSPNEVGAGRETHRDRGGVGDVVVGFPAGGAGDPRHVRRGLVGADEAALDGHGVENVRDRLGHGIHVVADVQGEPELAGRKSGQRVVGAPARHAAGRRHDDAGQRGAPEIRGVVVGLELESGRVFQQDGSAPQIGVGRRMVRQAAVGIVGPSIEGADDSQVRDDGARQRACPRPFQGEFLGEIVEREAVVAGSQIGVVDRIRIARRYRGERFGGNAINESGSTPLLGPCAVGHEFEGSACGVEGLGADPDVVGHEDHAGSAVPGIVGSGNGHAGIRRTEGMGMNCQPQRRRSDDSGSPLHGHLKCCGRNPTSAHRNPTPFIKS